MAVTGTGSASPAASATGTEQQNSRNAASAGQSPSSAAAARESTAAALPGASKVAKKAAAAQPVSPPFSLTYHFDEQTQRMILEARDPDSGFVVYQMPPKYIIKQFDASASGTVPSTRGGKLDNAV